MIVRITGHTKGIGKCLYDDLIKSGHDVKGFSRSNGYNIKLSETRQQIVNESQDADIFINNAWPDGDLSNLDPDMYVGQTELLKSMIAVWDKNKDKRILNFSSKASFNNVDVSPFMEIYGKNKRDQNKIIQDRINVYGPHILNVILGCTDTELSNRFEGKKIDPKELSEWVIKMLLCETMYFQSVTVDASELDYKFK
jgi:nucleoside-diphosphate-sugar epimerase